MHIAILSRFQIVRFIVQPGFRSVFNDQESFWFEPVIGKNKVVDLWDVIELIRRIRKHQIDGSIWFFEVFEYVCSIGAYRRQLQCTRHIPDKVDTRRVFVDGINPGGTA